MKEHLEDLIAEKEANGTSGVCELCGTEEKEEK